MKLISSKVYNNPNATLLSYFIAIVSFGRYSHSELVFNGGRSLNISLGHDAEFLTRYYINPKEWDTIHLYISPKEESHLKKTVVDSIIGHKYDLGGALLSILKLCTLQKPNKLFCSEAIADLLRNTEVYSSLNKGCRYSPVTLHEAIVKINNKYMSHPHST